MFRLPGSTVASGLTMVLNEKEDSLGVMHLQVAASLGTNSTQNIKSRFFTARTIFPFSIDILLNQCLHINSFFYPATLAVSYYGFSSFEVSTNPGAVLNPSYKVNHYISVAAQAMSQIATATDR